ncbi:MAG: SURF1 family protein [Ilumatobacteraceae bacterium]
MWRPRWIALHLAVLVGILGCASLSQWQWRRHVERRDFNAALEARAALAPADAASLVDAPPAGVAWRTVEAVGRWVPEATLEVVNRSQDGRAGRNVVTPLRLASGTLVLVVRGFAPLDVAVAPPPAGEVRVAGVVRESEARRRGQVSDPPDGPLREAQRLDVARLAPQMPGPGAPGWRDARATGPADDPMLSAIPAPRLDGGPHLSYVVQWIVIGAFIAAGWVVVVRRRARAPSGSGGAPASAAPPTAR